MVVYADNAGTPSTLLQTSTEVVNPSTGYQAFAFSSFDLAADSAYWLGYHTDTSFTVSTGTSTASTSWGPRLGYSRTYTSGPTADLTGVSPLFASSTSANLCYEFLGPGTYDIKVYGTPEWAPSSANGTPGANATLVSLYTASDSLTNVVAGHIRFAASHTGAKVKMVMYADDGSSPGHPTTLLAASSEVVNIPNGVLDFTFVSSFNITSGTKYWVGYITDTSAAAWLSPAAISNSAWQDTSTTYASGPLNPLYTGTTHFIASKQIQEIWLDNGTPTAPGGLVMMISSG